MDSNPVFFTNKQLKLAHHATITLNSTSFFFNNDAKLRFFQVILVITGRKYLTAHSRTIEIRDTVTGQICCISPNIQSVHKSFIPVLRKLASRLDLVSGWRQTWLQRTMAEFPWHLIVLQEPLISGELVMQVVLSCSRIAWMSFLLAGLKS